MRQMVQIWLDYKTEELQIVIYSFARSDIKRSETREHLPT